MVGSNGDMLIIDQQKKTMKVENYDDSCGSESYEGDSYSAYEPQESQLKHPTCQHNLYFSKVSDIYIYIMQKAKDEILDIFPFLTLDQLMILLVTYKYDFDEVKERLGEDLELLLHEDKILAEGSIHPANCLICEQEPDPHHLSCCGRVCQSCMDQYLRYQILEWRLELSCPVCNVKILPSTLNQDLFFEFRNRFAQAFMKIKQNYAECPDCHTYVEFWKDKKVVECQCHCEICLSCGELAHQPLDCETYKEWKEIWEQKWNEKSINQGLNLAWIMINTKQCKSCGWFIEKNSGCNHMTCKKCRYEFCWLCLADWKNHTKCSKYPLKETFLTYLKKIQQHTQVDWSEDSRLQFYGMRHQNFKQGEEFAKTMRQGMPEKISVLSQLLVMSEDDFTFIYEALNTIIKTRRRVMCLYVYIFMKELGEQEKELLEYNLETVQTHLEELTLTIYGIIDEGFRNGIDQQSLLALQKKIREYKNNVDKFAGLILECVENKDT